MTSQYDIPIDNPPHPQLAYLLGKWRKQLKRLKSIVESKVNKVDKT